MTLTKLTDLRSKIHRFPAILVLQTTIDESHEKATAHAGPIDELTGEKSAHRSPFR